VDFTDHVGRVDKEMKQDAIQDAMDRMSSGLEDAGDE
jgi:hypothetical protein